MPLPPTLQSARLLCVKGRERERERSVTEREWVGVGVFVSIFSFSLSRSVCLSVCLSISLSSSSSSVCIFSHSFFLSSSYLYLHLKYRSVCSLTLRHFRASPSTLWEMKGLPVLCRFSRSLTLAGEGVQIWKVGSKTWKWNLQSEKGGYNSFNSLSEKGGLQAVAVGLLACTSCWRPTLNQPLKNKSLTTASKIKKNLGKPPSLIKLTC